MERMETMRLIFRRYGGLMKTAFMILSIVLSALAFGDVDDHVDPPNVTVIRSVRSYEPPYNWCDRRYVVTLFRQGDRFFLRSRIEGTCYSRGGSFLRDLGKNIEISPRGLFFENGAMAVEYRAPGAEKWRKARVPFGDVYGSTHISEMPPYRESKPSEKYGVCGVSEEDDAVIESCIPTVQSLIRRDDAEGLSLMMRYPLAASFIEQDFVENREEFVKLYPRLFPPERKREILNLRKDEIFCSYKGLMINGGMWFFVTDGKIYFNYLF